MSIGSGCIDRSASPLRAHLDLVASGSSANTRISRRARTTKPSSGRVALCLAERGGPPLAATARDACALWQKRSAHSTVSPGPMGPNADGQTFLVRAFALLAGWCQSLDLHQRGYRVRATVRTTPASASHARRVADRFPAHLTVTGPTSRAMSTWTIRDRGSDYVSTSLPFPREVSRRTRRADRPGREAPAADSAESADAPA